VVLLSARRRQSKKRPLSPLKGNSISGQNPPNEEKKEKVPNLGRKKAMCAVFALRETIPALKGRGLNA